MVAIGRALMSNPRLILCDEISLGLAPVVIRDIYETLPVIKAEGTSVVLVEQDVVKAMAEADHVVCFQEGRLTLEGDLPWVTDEAIRRCLFRGPTGMASVDRHLVQGSLLGGLYALFAAGLSLMFGVMRLVNLAHGDIIVLAAFLILVASAITRPEHAGGERSSPFPVPVRSSLRPPRSAC